MVCPTSLGKFIVKLRFKWGLIQTHPFHHRLHCLLHKKRHLFASHALQTF